MHIDLVGRSIALENRATYANISCRAPLAGLLRSLAVLLVVALVCVAVWFMVRRLTGAFQNPLGGGTIVATGTVAILAVAAARLIWRHAGDAQDASWLLMGMTWLPGVALGLLALGIWIPGSPWPATALFCGLIVAEEFVAAALRTLPKPAIQPAKPQTTEIVPKNRPVRVWQQSRRERQIDGRDTIFGTLRTAFVCGQRTTIEHLVFCPMLVATPAVRATAIAAPDCSVKATHVCRYGARLEIKLAEPCDEPVELVISYEVRG
jgi:hypothetical protein